MIKTSIVSSFLKTTSPSLEKTTCYKRLLGNFQKRKVQTFLPALSSESNRINSTFLCVKNYSRTEFSNTFIFKKRSISQSNQKTSEAKVSVFISYPWTQTELVNELENQLDSSQVRIVRDVKDVSYRGNLQDFMKRIRKTDFALVVIGDSYLRSRNCMYEFLQLIKDEDFKERLLPIILPDANIYTSQGSIDYIEYWQEKLNELNQLIKNKKLSFENGSALGEELRILREINNNVGDLIHHLRFTKVNTLDEFKASNYQDIKNEILKIQPRKSEEEPKTNNIFNNPWTYLLSIIGGGVAAVGLSKLIDDKLQNTDSLPQGIPQLSENFKGREDVLKKLQGRLLIKDPKEPTKLIILRGLGSIGKTQIATKFIHDNRKAYGLIKFINAESEKALYQSYQDLARQIERDPDIGKMELPELMYYVNSKLQKHDIPWLLVFDDAKFENAQEWAQFEKNLPKCGGSILITSRSCFLDNREKILPIVGLSQSDANNLLQCFIPKRKLNEKDLKTLISELGGHPLALTQASKFIRNNPIVQISDYLELLKKNHLQEDDDPTEIVKVTCKLALEAIEKAKNNKVLETLHMCAYLAASPIAVEWLYSQYQDSSQNSSEATLKLKLNNDLKLLESYSLITIDEKSSTFSIHQLIQKAAQEYLAQKFTGSKMVAIAAAIKTIKQQWAKYDFEKISRTQPIGSQLLSHTEAVNQTKQEINELSPSLLDMLANTLKDAGIYCYYQHSYILAKDYFEQALPIYKAHYGDNHSKVAGILNKLGGTHICLSEYSKAISHFKQALLIYKAHYGDNHPRVANILNNLGAAHIYLKEYREAVNYLEQVLSIYRIDYGNDPTNVARVLGNLGNAYSLLGEPHKAINKFLKPALSIYKDCYGNEHPRVADALTSLGYSYNRLNKNQEAISSYLEPALLIYKTCPDDNQPAMAATLNGLGIAYIGLKKYDQSITYLDSALSIYEACYGGNSTHVADVLINLGSCYNGSSKCNEAISNLNRALSIYQACYGNNHPSTADALSILGNSYEMLGEHHKAISNYLEPALLIYKACYGNKHPKVADVLVILGYSYEGSGEYHKSINCLEEVSLIYKTNRFDNCTKTVDVQETLEIVRAKLLKSQAVNKK